MPHAEEPDLCGRVMAKQAFGCGIIIPVYLIGACLNVNRDNLPWSPAVR